MNYTKITLACLATFLMMGCAAPQPFVPDPVPVTAPPDATERIFEIGKSVEGHPIPMHVFGSGPQPILILGGIHGNEKNSAECAALLVEHLRSHPSYFQGISVAIIPSANPDGLIHGIRFNAHRVDLNRNFPAANWTKIYSSGKAATSEPETQALLAAIQNLQPRRILSIHSIVGKPCNNFDGPALALATAMSLKNSYPVKDSIGYSTPGSLGSWAGVDRHIPIITLELPFALPGRESWGQNHQAILAFVRGVD